MNGLKRFFLKFKEKRICSILRLKIFSFKGINIGGYSPDFSNGLKGLKMRKRS